MECIIRCVIRKLNITWYDRAFSLIDKYEIISIDRLNFNFVVNKFGLWCDNHRHILYLSSSYLPSTFAFLLTMSQSIILDELWICIGI